MFRRRIRREQALASIEVSGQRIECLIKRSSARRGLALRVNAQGLAQVNAPLAMPMRRIEDFLSRHQDWLRAQLDQRSTGLAWHDGMRLPWLGGDITLVFGAGPLVLAGACLTGAVDPSGAAVVAWYRRQALGFLADRLAMQCARLGMAVPPWRLSNARTRWGSLSPKGVVGLNWRLVKADPDVVDYVICHELAHFRHRDHSPAFWREVGRLYPEYSRARVRLRAQSAGCMAF